VTTAALFLAALLAIVAVGCTLVLVFDAIERSVS
jgi:hypothetical protein